MQQKITFDAKLRALRGLHGLTQTELAEMANIGQWDVTMFERGLTPSSAKKEALETALNIKFDDPETERAFLVLIGQTENICFDTIAA